jgi:hypothetical protein
VDDYILTPIVPCSKCGVRYAEDLTRDGMGRRLPEEELQEMDLRPPLCDSCRRQEFGEALEADILYVIEHGLGLTAENKETLKALVTVVGNQDRALMVARALDRADALELKLEDKTASLEDKLESKLDSMSSRLWISSWVTNFLFFLCGVLVGVVVALVSGG